MKEINVSTSKEGCPLKDQDILVKSGLEKSK